MRGRFPGGRGWLVALSELRSETGELEGAMAEWGGGVTGGWRGKGECRCDGRVEVGTDEWVERRGKQEPVHGPHEPEHYALRPLQSSEQGRDTIHVLGVAAQSRGVSFHHSTTPAPKRGPGAGSPALVVGSRGRPVRLARG